ncbi:MAG: serine/threonine-protein kinase, partial [Sphingobacteriales bacterium]
MTTSPQNNKDPSNIGHYEIRDCIGRGGMGLVYLGRDTRLDRPVAIKCLRAELFEKNYRERFKREALLLARLNHSNIVQIYDFIETEEQLALVMEYVDGRNLQQQLREQLVSFSQRMSWLAQISQGLAIAHDSGIIHRDLKAENILVSKRNVAKISDFGIAKSQDLNSTLTEHVAGSYCSMSPEQAMGEELNFKSDLFSLGILAYQMLCGSHPFGDTENKLQLMQRIISHPPISPTKNNADFPSEITLLLGQLLSKNPENRPDNTHWVAAEFERLRHLVLEDSFGSDDTQIIMLGSVSSKKNEKIPDAAKRKQGVTQEHPTFDNYLKASPTLYQRIRNAVKQHQDKLILLSLALVLIAGIFTWYFQPKPPRYIAVLLPSLTSNGMNESQQELTKSAVYDAIRQSILQLNSYYLIPHGEISDVNPAAIKEDLETIRRATFADELITTEIKCNFEACTVSLTRLVPDEYKDSRLRVKDTRAVDILADNYLSVATIVQGGLGALFSERLVSVFEKIDEKDYEAFLGGSFSYREQGASPDILNLLDGFKSKTKSLSAVQSLYLDVALDLENSTKDSSYIERLEKYLDTNPTKGAEIVHLSHQYYLLIAQGNMNEAERIIDEIKRLNPSASFINELYAYQMMSIKDYQAAIKFYKKAIESKRSVNNLMLLAKALWYSGNNIEAKKYIQEALHVSPNQSKLHYLNGLVALTEGSVQDAIRSFEFTVSKNNNDISSLKNLGLSYLLNQQYAEAITVFDRAFSLNAEDATLLLNIADAQELLGDIHAARNGYQKVIALVGGQADS